MSDERRTPTTHELKCWPGYFPVVAAGIKRFEVRRNDRDFHAQDLLHLREWWDGEYTGRETWQRVTYVLHADTNLPGVEPGFVVLSLEQEPCDAPHPVWRLVGCTRPQGHEADHRGPLGAWAESCICGSSLSVQCVVHGVGSGVVS